MFKKKSKYSIDCTGSTSIHVKQALFLFRHLHICVTSSTVKIFLSLAMYLCGIH